MFQSMSKPVSKVFTIVSKVVCSSLARWWGPPLCICCLNMIRLQYGPPVTWIWLTQLVPIQPSNPLFDIHVNCIAVPLVPKVLWRLQKAAIDIISAFLQQIYMFEIFSPPFLPLPTISFLCHSIIPSPWHLKRTCSSLVRVRFRVRFASSWILVMSSMWI